MVTTPQISSLASRLAAPARLLATRLHRGGAANNAPDAAPSAGGSVPQGPLAGRLHVPVFATAPQAAAWNGTVHTWAGAAREGRWLELLEALRAADRSRTAAPGGRRLGGLISEGARADLGAALQRQDWPAAEACIDRLEAVRNAHPEDYLCAHLLAQAHVDLGWARRKAEPGPGVPREVWQYFLHHTALAEAALADFDPLEEDSPLLAGTRYLLVRGIEDGDTFCRDWYEDWSDLDPTNPEPHLAHAVHLLPPWFGNPADFDREARTAMKRTEHCSGASAYAMFHLAAEGAPGGMPSGMDLPLFLCGLNDFFRATGCQYRANIVAAALTGLDRAGARARPGEAAAGQVHRRLVREALDEHLRENLREFHLSAWTTGEADIDHALEQVFGKELARGEHVFLGPVGLTSHLPV